MLLKVVQAGDPVLRKTARKLTKSQLLKPETQQLIDLMLETLHDAPGVGIAAPQVGESLQIIVIHDKAEYHQQLKPETVIAQGRVPVPITVLVNPIFEPIGTDTATYFEGCLSVLGYRAAVTRSTRVKATGWDRHGNLIALEAAGWFARIIQHETLHLQGQLYLEKANPRSIITDKYFMASWKDATEAQILVNFAEAKLPE